MRFTRKNELKLEMKCFRLWKIDLFELNKKKIILSKKERGFFLRKILQKWSLRLQEKIRENKSLQKSDIIYRILLMRRYFHSILDFKEKQKNIRLCSEAIGLKSQNLTKTQYLGLWVESYKKSLSKRFKSQKEDFKLLKVIFFFFLLLTNFIYIKYLPFFIYL